MIKFEDVCDDILKTTKKYIEKKNYEGLKEYIERKEKYVEICRKKQKNETSEYIDKLVVSLD